MWLVVLYGRQIFIAQRTWVHLVELAIVLVIIGLLVGGVMVGRDSKRSYRSEPHDSGDGRVLRTGLLLMIVVGSGIMGEQLAAGNAAVALLGNSIATGAGGAITHGWKAPWLRGG